MLRPTTEDDVKELIAICRATGVFQPQELETVVEVFDEYFYNEYEKGHRSFTVVQDKRIDGFIYIAPAALTLNTWELWWIVTRPEAQGSGVGKTMLRYAEDYIKTAGGRQIYMDTSAAPTYEPTRRFYARNGYIEAARLPDFYAPNDAKVIYRKVL